MKVQLFALMLAVAAPLSVEAASTNRSYIEFGYAQTGTPLTDLYSASIHDYRGGAIKGQWAFSEKWNASLGYTQGSSGRSEIELSSKWSLGLGFRNPISDKVDLLVGLNYSDVNEVFRFFSRNGIDSQVWGAEVGVAGGGDKFTGEVALGYETWDANVGGGDIDDDQVYLRFNGGYNFNENWSLQAQYKAGFSDSNSAFVGARYSF